MIFLGIISNENIFIYKEKNLHFLPHFSYPPFSLSVLLQVGLNFLDNKTMYFPAYYLYTSPILVTIS